MNTSKRIKVKAHPKVTKIKSRIKGLAMARKVLKEELYNVKFGIAVTTTRKLIALNDKNYKKARQRSKELDGLWKRERDILLTVREIDDNINFYAQRVRALRGMIKQLERHHRGLERAKRGDYDLVHGRERAVETEKKLIANLNHEIFAFMA